MNIIQASPAGSDPVRIFKETLTNLHAIVALTFIQTPHPGWMPAEAQMHWEPRT